MIEYIVLQFHRQVFKTNIPFIGYPFPFTPSLHQLLSNLHTFRIKNAVSVSHFSIVLQLSVPWSHEWFFKTCSVVRIKELLKAANLFWTQVNLSQAIILWQYLQVIF